MQTTKDINRRDESHDKRWLRWLREPENTPEIRLRGPSDLWRAGWPVAMGPRFIEHNGRLHYSGGGVASRRGSGGRSGDSRQFGWRHEDVAETMACLRQEQLRRADPLNLLPFLRGGARFSSEYGWDHDTFIPKKMPGRRLDGTTIIRLKSLRRLPPTGL